ncbi:MAG: DEAD/DEAH box helicase [Anaerolineae bacterium]|nr:DEAD/DEAH box helicase [Anaerolineae bacterium]MDH7475133.1 DEAD/DEAH box helicase [Anaerolineae bacterium]
MGLYPYQEKVKALLHVGRSVVLQAPTGSGKTRAALAPFIEAFFDLPPMAFPRQCLYTVPMRVLATQFEHEYRHLAESYERRFGRRLDVRIQTGERPEDPELMGDLVFATLDQVLSSAFGVPYSLPAGKANVNVGAVLSSYLVFDEFHLFPPQAMQATLQLLRLLNCFVPFVLMTATFSETMLYEIASLLDAEPVLVSAGEVAQIETRQGERPRKTRCFSRREKTLEAGDVLETHDRRSLAVCNTVDRALELYRALVDQGCRPVPVDHSALTPLYERLRYASSPDEHRCLLDEAVKVLRTEIADAPADTNWVMLLHSRFERPHRQVKEAFLRTECGPQDEEKGQCWFVPRLLVVATQVVEVGLDITSQALHTELAPAANVIQRAGRCARYPGEQGQVYVYPVPTRNDGRPNYAPYSSKEEASICELTEQALRERNGQVLDFAGEQAVVNEAHQEADRAVLQAMREDEGRLWELISDGLIRGEVPVRRELIRQVDSRTLIVYDAPDGVTEESPFCYEGFSLWHGTLRGAVENLLEQAEGFGLPWALRYPIVQRDEEDSRAPTAYHWLDVESTDDISSSLLFAIHPALVSYDPAQGFRLGGPSDGAYCSPQAPRRRNDREQYSYDLESYIQHVQDMQRAFEHHFRDRLTWIATRLGMGGLLEKTVRLVLALHDVGKLQVEWQEWAVKYQKRVSGEKPHFLVAHTTSRTKEHREIARQIYPKRPHHAGEGAFAAARILWEALEGNNHRPLYQAAVTAIARHHSPSLQEAAPYRLHPRAAETVADALAAVGDDTWWTWAQWLMTENNAPNLEKRLLQPPPPWDGWLLYFIIVRILRLCDGLSQEEE